MHLCAAYVFFLVPVLAVALVATAGVTAAAADLAEPTEPVVRTDKGAGRHRAG